MLSFEAHIADPTVYSRVNKLFKNQKAFFEKGERDILKDQLEELLSKMRLFISDMKKNGLKSGRMAGLTDEAEGLRHAFIERKSDTD